MLRSGFRDFAAHLIRPPLLNRVKAGGLLMQSFTTPEANGTGEKETPAPTMNKKGLCGYCLTLTRIPDLPHSFRKGDLFCIRLHRESIVYEHRSNPRGNVRPISAGAPLSHQHLRFRANACYNALKRNASANVAELADAPDLGSGSRKGMGVRPSPFAPQNKRLTPLLSKVLTVRVNGLVVKP